MDTDEHTPVPKDREQERNEARRRMLRTAITAATPLILALATMYLQRSSDKADVDSKAKAVEQKVDNAKAAADKAIASVKTDIATVSNAAQPVAQLAVETHEDVATRPGKRRTRVTDPKLLLKVQDSIRNLKKVEAKAALPAPKPPSTQVATTDAGVPTKADGQNP